MDASESLDSEQLCRAADVQLIHSILMGLAESTKDVRHGPICTPRGRIVGSRDQE